jgi:hypothetical protein
MTDPATRPNLGILAATEQRAALLQRCLHEAGYCTRVASILAIMRGEWDVRVWLDGLDPTVILYDIHPPYAEHWYFYRWVGTLPAAARHRFLATTPDRAALEAVAGPGESVEVVGTRDELATIVRRIETILAEIERGAGTPAGIR